MDLAAWSLVLFTCVCTLRYSYGCDEYKMKDILKRMESLESSNKMLVQNDITLRRIIRRQQRDIQFLQGKLGIYQDESKDEPTIEHSRKEHSGEKTAFTENSVSKSSANSSIVGGWRETNGLDKILGAKEISSPQIIVQENMPKSSPDEDNVARQVRFVQNSPGIVAFHATINRGEVSHLTSGQMVVFDNVLMNAGNGYHTSAGVFIAQKAGLYIFSVSVLSYHLITVNLEKNGKTIASVYCYGHTSGEGWRVADQGSVTIVTDVQIGDEVFAKVDERGGNLERSLYGDNYTSFMGVLLIQQ